MRDFLRAGTIGISLFFLQVTFFFFVEKIYFIFENM